MYDNIIKLVAEEKTVNDYGDFEVATTERVVFADLRSITQSEFYQAQATGLKPEIKFVIADYLDYQNEKKILYQPFHGIEEEYSVLRTYRDGNQLEIVCKRGVDHAAST